MKRKPSPTVGPRNPARLARWLDAFSKLKIGVLGDFAADHYVVGITSRISREAPVLILKKREEFVLPGQAGNSAANLAALGVSAFGFGFVGQDAEGAALRKALSERGVEPAGLLTLARSRTIVKTRILSGAHHTALQQVIRVDDDESLAIGAVDRLQLAGALEAKLPDLDGLLVSDYGYGTVEKRLWKAASGAGGRKGAPLVRVVDSRYAMRDFKGADALVPNETEVFAQLGIRRFASADPVTAGLQLKKATRCRGLIMTRGNEGMLVFGDRAQPAALGIFGTGEVTDVTGAGDTVAAVVTAVLAAGGSIEEAAELANVAAGLAVMKRGAATVSRDEIRAALANGGRPRRS